MELRDYLRGIRRHFLAIVIMTAVGVGVAYAWTLIQTPVYEATADGIIQSREVEDVNNPFGGESQARQKVQTYLQMTSWQKVADEAIAELGLQISADQAVARIVVVNPNDTAILRVTAQGSS